MYILLDNQGKVLIDEIDYLTGDHHQHFVDPKRIVAINSYRNKKARLKTFFPWYSFKNDYRLVRKGKWLWNLRKDYGLQKNTI